MPRGDKSKYTDKQKRMAEHIEEGYEERGMNHERAEAIAWATVNKETGGGKKPGGSGRGKKIESHAAESGGASQSHAKRSEAAKKGWATRRQNAGK